MTHDPAGLRKRITWASTTSLLISSPSAAIICFWKCQSWFTEMGLWVLDTLKVLAGTSLPSSVIWVGWIKSTSSCSTLLWSKLSLPKLRFLSLVFPLKYHGSMSGSLKEEMESYSSSILVWFTFTHQVWNRAWGKGAMERPGFKAPLRLGASLVLTLAVRPALSLPEIWLESFLVHHLSSSESEPLLHSLYWVFLSPFPWHFTLSNFLHL